MQIRIWELAVEYEMDLKYGVGSRAQACTERRPSPLVPDVDVARSWPVVASAERRHLVKIRS